MFPHTLPNSINLLMYFGLLLYTCIQFKKCQIYISLCLSSQTVCKKLMLSQSDIEIYRYSESIFPCFHVFLQLTFQSWNTMFSRCFWKTVSSNCQIDISVCLSPLSVCKEMCWCLFEITIYTKFVSRKVYFHVFMLPCYFSFHMSKLCNPARLVFLCLSPLSV